MPRLITRMSTKQMRDWKGWLDGLRTNVLKAGATSIVTNLSVLASTNTVAAMGIPSLRDAGENWKTFLIGLVAQFIIHSLYAAALYVQSNPDAPMITQTVDTTFISKAADGSGVTQSSTKTTTTPVAPADSKTL